MATPKFRVLLVEEDVELANLMMGPLTSAGFQGRHVAQTASGMAAFKSQRPHLVLLNLGLPHIGGATLCGPIRALSSVPIVILSVRTRREDHLHALNLGADEFITMRPFDEQVTMARILTIMRRVYHYAPPEVDLKEPLKNVAPPQPLSELPAGWATCHFCGYMGPANRFDRINTLGERAMSCPHCDRSQNLVFTVA